MGCWRWPPSGDWGWHVSRPDPHEPPGADPHAGWCGRGVTVLPSPPYPDCRIGRSAQAGQVALYFLAREAISLLDLAAEHFVIALDLVQLVIGELAPAGLHLALHLPPVAFENVAIHVSPSAVVHL